MNASQAPGNGILSTIQTNHTFNQSLQVDSMPIAEIEEILTKYKQNEIKIEHLLTVKQENVSPASACDGPSEKAIGIEEVQARNKQIMKDLEIAKANLRSKAIFSPSEMQWQKIYNNYNQCPSMPVTTYKCHKAVFV